MKAMDLRHESHGLMTRNSWTYDTKVMDFDFNLFYFTLFLLFYCKRIRDAAFFFIIMLVTFAATLLKPQNYVSSRTIQKCVEHVSTST